MSIPALAAGKAARIGQPFAAPVVGAREQHLAELGWTVGRNVRIDYRWGAGDADRTRKYAAELVALAPDVILANGSAAVGPLLQATRSMPIVFVAPLADAAERRSRRAQPEPLRSGLSTNAAAVRIRPASRCVRAPPLPGPFQGRVTSCAGGHAFETQFISAVRRLDRGPDSGRCGRHVHIGDAERRCGKFPTTGSLTSRRSHGDR